MDEVVRFGVDGPVGVVGGLRRRGDESRAPIVLLHGVNGAAEQWAPTMALLDGRTSIAIDLRAHGGSAPAGAEAGYAARDYAADVEAVLDGLDVESVHLVGTSFGGGVAATVAAQRPQRIGSLAVLGGALTVAGLADADAAVAALHEAGPAAFFELVAGASFAPGTDPELLRASVELAARNDADTVERILRAAFGDDVTASAHAAAAAGIPALVANGEHDQTCPPELGAAFAQALGCEHHVLPGRGHMAHVEEPALVASLIERHVRAAEGAGVR
jgi:3-oxoadipate enol-lactonase